MWSTASTWCYDCSQWVNFSRWRSYFASKSRSGSGTNTSAADRSKECDCRKVGDVEDGWVLRASTTQALVDRKEPVKKYGQELNLESFNDVTDNRVSWQSVTSRRHSLSDSDSSSVRSSNSCQLQEIDVGGASDVVNYDMMENHEGDQFVRHPAHTLHFSAIPAPSIVTVTQQPRGVEIHRPDVTDNLNTSDNSSISYWTAKRRYQRLQHSRSLNSSPLVLSRNTLIKGRFPNYLSPEEAALPPPSLRLESDATASISSKCSSMQGPPQLKLSPSLGSNLSVLGTSLRRSIPMLRSQDDEEADANNGVVEMGKFSRLMDRVVGGQQAGKANFEYRSPNRTKDSSTKVQLRSKKTAESIISRTPTQMQTLTQYTFGIVNIVYRFSKEKKMEVDVVSVTRLPKYTTVNQEEDRATDAKISTLNYVDVEISLRLSYGKVLTHKIKKFRAGDVPTDDDAFEPECKFKGKDLEESLLVLSVSRRGKGISSPHLCIGHALLEVPRKEILTTGVLRRTLLLKQGAQRQDVKGSVHLVLTCEHPVSSKEVNLTLDVRMVQHVDVSLLGISHSSPDFKIKPEIKMKIQLLGSSKVGSKKPSEFPWLALQNRNQFVPKNKEDATASRKSSTEAKTFRGWGTHFPDGCHVVRTAYDSELREFSLCYVMQVYGRNNVASYGNKEVLLGTVVLGPEHRSSQDSLQPTSEESPLTHWGQAISRRTAVEMLHRMHL